MVSFQIFRLQFESKPPNLKGEEGLTLSLYLAAAAADTVSVVEMLAEPVMEVVVEAAEAVSVVEVPVRQWRRWWRQQSRCLW